MFWKSFEAVFSAIAMESQLLWLLDLWAAVFGRLCHLWDSNPEAGWDAWSYRFTFQRPEYGLRDVRRGRYNGLLRGVGRASGGDGGQRGHQPDRRIMIESYRV